MTEAGWLAVLIPEEYGGAGLGVTEASIILEEIHRAGGNAAACHAQMYVMGTLLRHGSAGPKRNNICPLSLVATYACKPLASPSPMPAPTRPRSAPPPPAMATVIASAVKRSGFSRAQHSDLLLLLARTTPLDQVDKPTNGLSIFLVDPAHLGRAMGLPSSRSR